MENENKKMKPGQKYLSGYLDLGILGQHKVTFFPNNSDTENAPDFKSKHGSIWINKKKDKPKITEEKN